MKLYLDDIRKAPEGWVPVRTFGDAIQLLEEQTVEEMSFDHDLGMGLTGYDVLKWIERKVFEGTYIPPKIWIHTGNPVGRKKMLAAKKQIEKMMKERSVQEIVEQIHIEDVTVQDVQNLKTLLGKRNVG
ncbi:MAG: cyclic-phosphate processing receiver domain-containing protein [bacterium]